MTGGGGNNKFLYGLCASDNGERWHSISGGTACLASSCRSFYYLILENRDILIPSGDHESSQKLLVYLLILYSSQDGRELREIFSGDIK